MHCNSETLLGGPPGPNGITKDHQFADIRWCQVVQSLLGNEKDFRFTAKFDWRPEQRSQDRSEMGLLWSLGNLIAEIWIS